MDDHYHDTGLTGRAWFKPLVALWFGVLAAAGMGFMPPDVHNAILRGTGLTGIHPVLAVPVGRNGVIALCAAAGLLGAVIGLLIAWRIAAAGSRRGFAPGFSARDESYWAEEEAAEEPRRRRVFSARDDIGEEGITISAPTEPTDGEADYESEYSLGDIPPVSPDEDFDAVYAGMDADYVPSEGEAEPVEIEHEDLVEIEPETEQLSEHVAEYAEFEEVAEPDYQPQREVEAEHRESAASGTEHESDSQPLGDMSLDALVGRLGAALDQHRRLVAGSEEAAREPAPRPIPMTREPEQAGDDAGQGLPEVADDDPVIAFLRREASRRMPDGAATEAQPETREQNSAPSASSQTDAQAALRSALDRLGKASPRDD